MKSQLLCSITRVLTTFLHRQHQVDLQTKTIPLKPTLRQVPREQASGKLYITTSSNGLVLRREYKKVQKRTATLIMLQERYPETKIYKLTLLDQLLTLLEMEMRKSI